MFFLIRLCLRSSIFVVQRNDNLFVSFEYFSKLEYMAFKKSVHSSTLKDMYPDKMSTHSTIIQLVYLIRIYFPFYVVIFSFFRVEIVSRILETWWTCILSPLKVSHNYAVLWLQKRKKNTSMISVTFFTVAHKVTGISGWSLVCFMMMTKWFLQLFFFRRRLYVSCDSHEDFDFQMLFMCSL